MAWVYVLKLDDNQYYIGSTAYLSHRLAQHLSGNGAKATNSSFTIAPVTTYRCASRKDAYRLESYLQSKQRSTHNWVPPAEEEVSHLLGTSEPTPLVEEFKKKLAELSEDDRNVVLQAIRMQLREPVTIASKVEAALHAALRELATELDTSMSALIRDLILLALPVLTGKHVHELVEDTDRNSNVSVT